MDRKIKPPDLSSQRAPQSAQVEPVNGTSGVGPTTFQQDQSAKKKPMKSNNENEGDVSTIPQESDESAQQSAQVEPVSGTSWMGPTTFQQDQSAKMKPMKSNNENEGDVSTIPQESDESVQYFMDRRGILRGKCLLEDCDCSQYELPADSDIHYCSYCGDPPAKHLHVQTAESEKDDKEPEAQQSTAQVEPVGGTPGLGCKRPTTSQPDEIPKKIHKKSNNENEECIQVEIVQKGPITVGYGGTIKINANIISNSTGSLQVNWQKTQNNCITTLKINHFKFSGSSCQVNNPQLVINKVDKEDAGIYNVEVISPTEIKNSPGILLELYGDEADSLSKEESNFFRLYFLNQKIATQAVQLLFDSKVLDSFLKQHKSSLTSQSSRYRCTKDQEAKLFPGGHVAVVSTDFDFTLLYKLIRNLLTAIPAPTCRWGNQPLPGHLNEADDIERIRHLRNNFAHNSEFEISDTDFSTHWTDLSQAIDRLSKGSLSTEVESMRTKKFDKCIKNEMEENIRKELKELREEFMDLQQQVANNTQEIHNINTRNIPIIIYNEPHISIDFNDLVFWVKTHICEQLLSQKITEESMETECATSTPQTAQPQSTQSKNENKYRVEWKLATPNTWNVSEMKNTLQNVSNFLNAVNPCFEIEFVYIGSLVIRTIVPEHILSNYDDFKSAVRSFLAKIVEVCQLDTDTHEVVKVDLNIFTEILPMQYFMDRQGILRGKCLLEDCDCSQYELPADSETHLCSYCGDPPAKHFIVQTAESEKDDKEPEDQQIMKERMMERTLADIDKLRQVDTFVKTAVVKKVLSCLDEKRFVVLVGVQGSGKSRNSLELLRHYKKQDYHVIKLGDLIEFKQVVNIDDKYVVVIDDVFGKTNCKFNEELHSDSLDYIKTCIDRGQIKVVLTMRNSIKSSCKNIICRHRLFKDANFLDLNSDEFSMTVSEKEECLLKYCKYNLIDVLSSSSTRLNSEPETDSGLSVTFESINSIVLLGDNPCLGYPEICFLFTSNSVFTSRGISFFKHPIDFLCEDIESMRKKGQTNEHSRLQYTILVYILLQGNLINSFDLDLQAITSTMTDIFGTSKKLTLAVTKDCLKSLNGCYLHEDHNGDITFWHRIILESILMSCSDIDHGIIIPCLDLDFILEMVQPVGRKIAKGEIVFKVPKKSFKILAHRLLSILKKEYRVYPQTFMEKLCTSMFISLMGKDFIIDLCEEYIRSDCDDYILQSRMPFGHFDSKNVYKCNSNLLEKCLSYCNVSIDQCSDEHFFLPAEFLKYSDIYENDDELLENLLKIIKNYLQGRDHAYSKKACRRGLTVAILEACKINNKHQLNMIWQTVLDNHICFHLGGKLWSCYEAPIWKFFFKKIDIYFVNDINDIVDYALAEGKVKFIMWILRKFKYRTQAYDISEVLVKAYGIGNVNLVQLVIQIIGMLCVDTSLLKTAMLRACEEKTSKNWKLVVWTLERWPSSLFDMNKVMHYAFACNSVENVLWLLDKVDCGVFKLNVIVKKACRDGNLTLVKRLLEKYDRSKFNIKDVIDGYPYDCEELNQWLIDKFGQDLFFRCQSEEIESRKLAQSDGNDSDLSDDLYNIDTPEAYCDVPFETVLNRTDTFDDDKIMSSVNKRILDTDKSFNDESRPPPDHDFNFIIEEECSLDFIKYKSFQRTFNMYENKVDITKGMNFACLRAKLGIVMILFEGFHIEKFNSKSAFVEAYKSGNFELVSWLLTMLDGNQYEMKSLLDHIYATGVCSIDLFDFLLANFGDDLFEWNALMKSSIKGGNFQLVKRLFDIYYDKFDINEIILVACKENVDISTWLLKKFGKEKIDMDLIFTEVSGSGSCRLLHYILNHFGHDCFNIMKAMNCACKNGEIMSVSLLLKTFKDCQLKLFDYHTAMTNACSSSRLDVFCLLRDNVDSSHFDTKRIMNDTCKSGNIDSVKFLFQNFNAENFEIPSAFCAACQGGNCELVEWFIESFKLDTDDVREDIGEACVWSNTDVVKDLMVVSPGSVDHISLLREATDLNLITYILSTLDHGYCDTATEIYKACASKNHGKLKRLLKSSEIDMFDMEIAEKIARLSQDNLLLCMLEKFKRGPDTMNLRNILWIIVLPVVVLSIVLAVYFGSL